MIQPWNSDHSCLHKLGVVPEGTTEPDHDAALAEVKMLVWTGSVRSAMMRA